MLRKPRQLRRNNRFTTNYLLVDGVKLSRLRLMQLRLAIVHIRNFWLGRDAHPANALRRKPVPEVLTWQQFAHPSDFDTAQLYLLSTYRIRGMCVRSAYLWSGRLTKTTPTTAERPPVLSYPQGKRRTRGTWHDSVHVDRRTLISFKLVSRTLCVICTLYTAGDWLYSTRVRFWLLVSVSRRCRMPLCYARLPPTNYASGVSLQGATAALDNATAIMNCLLNKVY